MNPHRSRLQAGATLIEILVSILVISFGILAMAAVQSNAVKFHKTSEYRAIATQRAADMADRMRANASGTAAGNYAWATLNYTPLTAAGVGTPATCGNVAGTVLTPCTSSQIAANDLYEWRNALLNSLPNASGHIGAYDATTRGLDLWIAWEDPDEVDRNGNSTAPASQECPGTGVWPGPPTTIYHCIYLRVAL